MGDDLFGHFPWDDPLDGEEPGRHFGWHPELVAGLGEVEGLVDVGFDGFFHLGVDVKLGATGDSQGKKGGCSPARRRSQAWWTLARENEVSF